MSPWIVLFEAISPAAGLAIVAAGLAYRFAVPRLKRDYYLAEDIHPHFHNRPRPTSS